MKILGISAYYHDSSAALIEDGQILAAAQEERFTRIKGDSSFPHNAINNCLDTAKSTIADIDKVIFYENHNLKFERILSTYHIVGVKGVRSFLSSIPSWITDKLWMERKIKKGLGTKKDLLFIPHHLSHAASAFFPSPFDEAAILTVDGVGEWSTAVIGVGKANKIRIKKELRFPNSIGLLYSAFAYYTGFKVNSGEYKLMGLAPYGTPQYAEVIKTHLVDIKDDGSTILNQRYFSYANSLKMINKKFCDLFNAPPRKPESEITQFIMDIASSIQSVLNEILIKMASHVRQKTGMTNLVMAGGVALNSVANGLLCQEKIFENVWIQPASGDAGGALGAALWLWFHSLDNPRSVSKDDGMKGALLGYQIEPASFADDAYFSGIGAKWKTYSDKELALLVAQKLRDNKIVSIARGRAEFGPRALGNRSILGNAQNPNTQRHMNLKIKYRESFRPFAPMVLSEDKNDYFDAPTQSPYMLLVYPVSPKARLQHAEDKGQFGINLLNVTRSVIPAVTHVDYSARIQTVDRERQPFIHDILFQFRGFTDCSVIVNTSFNIRGEPIVNDAQDAFKCFMHTGIDCLVVGNRFFDKKDQSHLHVTDIEKKQWVDRYELD